MIEILNPTRVARARETGALVGHILHTLKSRAIVGTNLLEIDDWARSMIVDAGATSCYVDYEPSFGRGPFGHYICTSVNDAVLHGRPRDYRLTRGDLLSLDLAVSLDGVVADSALSFVVGEPPSGSALNASALAPCRRGSSTGTVSFISPVTLGIMPSERGVPSLPSTQSSSPLPSFSTLGHGR